MQSALFIGRFQPFHKGHLSVIEKILKNKERPLIVIGSAQESHTERNPLTAEERENLIKETLAETHLKADKDYEIGKLNDIGDYSHWSDFIHKILPAFNKVYTGSQLVKDCLSGKYSEKDCPPKFSPEIINLERILPIKATFIREKILKNESWENEVPKSVAKLLKKWNIQDRLKKIQNDKN